MDNIAHQVRLAQWIESVESCNHRSEGMTAKQWFNDNNISENRIITDIIESGRKF